MDEGEIHGLFSPGERELHNLAVHGDSSPEGSADAVTRWLADIDDAVAAIALQ